MSFSMRTQMTGLEELQQRLANVIEAGDASIEAISNFAAQSTAQRAKNIIKNSTPLGRTYFRDGPPRTVRASAPGQPPAIDTRYLLNSITFQKYSSGSAFAYVGAAYGADLEFGTDSISPRPYFTPAFEAAVAAAEKRFLTEFEGRL